MKIKAEKENLLKALQRVSNVIGTRTTLPVLANILIEAENGIAKITATDLEIRLVTQFPAEVIESGKTTLPAKKLLGLVSKFRDKMISIESNENHHSEIRCGTASIMLLGLNPDDFPASVPIESKRSIVMNQADLSMLIDRIFYAASIEASKKVLQGILLSIADSKITAVATDGKRLALAEKVLENLPEGSDGDIIITLKSATELKRLMEKTGTIEIKIADNQVEFLLGDTVVTSKLLEGNYPNYRQVIPSSFKNTISVPCEQFIYALEILCITLSETVSPNVKLTFKENKLLFEANSNIGEGSESIDIAYEGEEMSASFNPNFLLDPFKHLPMDNVFLKINDVVSPISIESGDGFLYVIMPMRSNK